MTNQPGLKMVIEKVMQQMQRLLKQFKIAPAATRTHPLQARSAQPAAPYTGQPLEVGQELLITEDVVKFNSRLSNVLGRVVIIDEMLTGGNKAVKASAFGIQVNVDVQMAQQMRTAFLIRQQA